MSVDIKMTTQMGPPESRRILSHLLHKLTLPDSPYKRFSEFMASTGSLEDLMYRCVRMDILALIDRGRIDLNLLEKRRNDDTSYTGRAIYLHVVKDESITRFYVGQTCNLKERMKNHTSFRSRQGNPSVHYHALQLSKEDYYITLSYVPDKGTCEHIGIRNVKLFLDLLETWCCLMFRTLSQRYLKEFLPFDILIPETTFEHLNVKLPPRDPYLTLDWAEIRDILLNSPDPLYQNYYHEKKLRDFRNNKDLTEHRKRSLALCKTIDFASTPSPIPVKQPLPSPLSTGHRQGARTPEPPLNQPMTPSTFSSARMNPSKKRPLADVSPTAGRVSMKVSKMDKSEHQPESRALGETQNGWSGARDEEMIGSDESGESSDSSREDWDLSVKRQLFFGKVAERDTA